MLSMRKCMDHLIFLLRKTMELSLITYIAANIQAATTIPVVVKEKHGQDLLAHKE